MRPGLLIADRFLIRSLLGRGGMGSVWLAHHVKLDAPCAVKFIEGPGAADPARRQRFTQEAKAAALLRSPHVVQIFDYGVWHDTPYLAMELLEGEELSKRLDRARWLAPAECLALAEQVARALSKAHAAGVVHRDLKPDNIFLAHDDGHEFVKVLDFGIAKLAAGHDGGATRDGAILGTPQYMSPEQTRNSRSVDFRSDLWSFAVIVFECLTGRRPFEGESLAEIVAKIVSDPLPVPSAVAPHLPPAFDAWWAHAAARDPAGRFSSAREMVEALAAALRLPVSEARSSPPAGAARSGPHAAVLPATVPHHGGWTPDRDELEATLPVSRARAPQGGPVEPGSPSPFALHGATTTHALGGTTGDVLTGPTPPLAPTQPGRRAIRRRRIALASLALTLGVGLFAARAMRAGAGRGEAAPALSPPVALSASAPATAAVPPGEAPLPSAPLPGEAPPLTAPPPGEAPRPLAAAPPGEAPLPLAAAPSEVPLPASGPARGAASVPTPASGRAGADHARPPKGGRPGAGAQRPPKKEDMGF